MIPTGYINYACDENTANNALLRGDVVLVINDNIDERIYPSDNVIHASILLPPFESICLLIDDTKDAFAISYSDYLLSRETDLYLLAITAGVFFKGSRIWLYFGAHEDNEVQFEIFKVLASYIAEGFGLFVGVPGTCQFSYDNTFDSFNLCRLYQSGLIDIKTLILNYPDKETFPYGFSIADRVTRELDLQWFKYPEERLMYLTEYKDQCKQCGDLLFDPLIAVAEGEGVK
jgi:hypothetical protein